MTETRTVDVAIIGAGRSGSTAARRLTQAGRPVVVIEAGDRVGGRATERAAAEVLDFGRVRVSGRLSGSMR